MQNSLLYNKEVERRKRKAELFKEANRGVKIKITKDGSIRLTPWAYRKLRKLDDRGPLSEGHVNYMRWARKTKTTVGLVKKWHKGRERRKRSMK